MATDQYRVAASTDDAWADTLGTFNNTDDFLRFGRPSGKQAPNYHFYVRLAISLAPGSVIQEARLTFTRSLDTVLQHGYNIRIEDAQDAPALTQQPTDFVGTPVAATIGPGTGEWTSPDLKALLQLWLDGLSGQSYAPGDHVVFAFLWQSSESAEIGRLCSYDGDPAKSAVLDVTSAAPTAIGAVRCTPTLVGAAAAAVASDRPIVAVAPHQARGTATQSGAPAALISLHRGTAAIG